MGRREDVVPAVPGSRSLPPPRRPSVLELDWPLWTHYHGNALSVTIRVPPGHPLRDATPTPDDRYLEELRDRLRSELIGAAVDMLASLMPVTAPDVILDPYTGEWYEVPEDSKKAIQRYLGEFYTSTLRESYTPPT